MQKRRYGHLTPRYVRDRLAVWFYQRRFKQHPWLTADAIPMLEELLRKSDRGIEWGSGRSTRWFASQVQHLVSVESSKLWFERVTQQLKDEGIENVDYHLVETTENDEKDVDARREYAQIARKLEDCSLDFALVDGFARGQCMLEALPKLKPGGILILDNANWYLPGPTRAPRSMKTGDAIVDAEFQRFAELTPDWRHVRTTNGVWDTWIWIVPPEWTAEKARG